MMPAMAVPNAEHGWSDHQDEISLTIKSTVVSLEVWDLGVELVLWLLMVY